MGSRTTLGGGTTFRGGEVLLEGRRGRAAATGRTVAQAPATGRRNAPHRPKKHTRAPDSTQVAVRGVAPLGVDNRFSIGPERRPVGLAASLHAASREAASARTAAARALVPLIDRGDRSRCAQGGCGAKIGAGSEHPLRPGPRSPGDDSRPAAATMSEIDLPRNRFFRACVQAAPAPRVRLTLPGPFAASWRCSRDCRSCLRQGDGSSSCRTSLRSLSSCLRRC